MCFPNIQSWRNIIRGSPAQVVYAAEAIVRADGAAPAPDAVVLIAELRAAAARVPEAGAGKRQFDAAEKRKTAAAAAYATARLDARVGARRDLRARLAWLEALDEISRGGGGGARRALDRCSALLGPDQVEKLPHAGEPWVSRAAVACEIAFLDRGADARDASAALAALARDASGGEEEAVEALWEAVDENDDAVEALLADAVRAAADRAAAERTRVFERTTPAV